MQVEVYDTLNDMNKITCKKEMEIRYNFQEKLPVYFNGYAWRIKDLIYPRNFSSLGSNYVYGKQINFGTYYVLLESKDELLIVDMTLITPIKHLTLFESFKLFFLNRIKYQLKDQ